MTDRTCDMPGCKGKRQILLMEPAMRCVCRRCWRRLEAAMNEMRAALSDTQPPEAD